MYTIVNPAMPSLSRGFDADPTAAAWLVTGYLIVSTIAAIAAGPLLHHLGARRAILGVVLATVAGGILAATSPNLTVAIVGRALQGISGAIPTIALSVVRAAWPPTAERAAFAVLSTWGAVGGGLGLLVGGPLAQFLGERSVFWFPAAVSAITAVVILRVPPVARVTGFRVDVAGLSLATVCLTVGLAVIGSARTLPSVIIIAGVAVVVALGAIWIVVERRVATPMIDVRAVGSPSTILVLIVNFVTGAVMIARLTTLAGFLELGVERGGLGMAPALAGLVLAPVSIGIIVSGFVLRSRVAVGLPATRILLTGAVLLGLGSALFAFWHDGPIAVAIASAINGLGIGAIFSASPVLVARSVSVVATAGMLGTMTVVRALGSTIGAQIAPAVLANDPALPLGLRAEDHVTLALASTLAMTACAAFVAFIRPRRTSIPD